MTKWMIFLFFWITMTISIHQGDVVAFTMLIPAFVILWAWAEELEDSEAPLLAVNTYMVVTVDDQLKSSTMGEDQLELDGKDADRSGDRSIRC